MFASQTRNVAQEDRDGHPDNTKRVYDLKEKEWHAYCDHLFATNRMHGPQVSYTVTKYSFFGFLYYQSCRK